MTTVYRQATEQDAQRIAEIHALSRATSMPWLPVVHTAAEDLWFYEHIVIPDQNVEVCEVDGTVIGFCAVSDPWLQHLYLDPSSQGKGIGSTLLASAKKGRKELNLWVFQQNVEAQAFYSKHGFIEVTRTDGAANEEKSPDIHLRWIQSDA